MGASGVIFFGDSVLAGTGASERDKSCAKIVKASLKIPVSLKARNWNTTRDGLERFEQDVMSQEQYSHVILLFGNNDCWLTGPGQNKVPLNEFKSNLTQMITSVKKGSKTPILCNLQTINQTAFMKQFPELDDYRKRMNMTAEEIQGQYNLGIEQVAGVEKVALIDIRSRLKQSSEETVAPDGIHPNDLGHRIIAETMLAYLSQAAVEHAEKK